MNNFITNISRQEIIDGTHEDAGKNSLLIQIVDFFDSFPEPKHKFKHVLQFKFDDIENEGPTSITQEQAEAIANAISFARAHDMNVVVHCFAGICRSGAVVECGVQIGFNPPDRVRWPNTLVKHKIQKALGIEINASTSCFAWDEEYKGIVNFVKDNKLEG